MLFVIDGSKGLRKAIRQVFGNDVPVQRCVQHKERNVLDHLPERDRQQVKARPQPFVGEFQVFRRIPSHRTSPSRRPSGGGVADHGGFEKSADAAKSLKFNANFRQLFEV